MKKVGIDKEMTADVRRGQGATYLKAVFMVVFMTKM